jgi:hypothetical protein
MKPKTAMTVKQQIEYWTQQYLQAKANGDTKLLKIYEAVIIRLGGKIPKL